MISFRNCEQFYKIPGNDTCCDCGSEKPRWASINLGVTLCIACSGVHRSLGVHYSKVRSLTLDGWEPEILKVMMELGNDVVNKIYEANYVDNTQENIDYNASNSGSHLFCVKRATSDCDISVRELWIKAKYIDRSFVVPIEHLKIFTQDEGPNLFENIIFKGTGWFVRQKRKKKINLKIEKIQHQNINDDISSASSSEVSVDSSQTQDELHLSDNYSTDDEDIAYSESIHDFQDLNSDMLLYQASAVHNLCVMCYAIASGASKDWSNPKDLNRSPLHKAVISVSKTLIHTISFWDAILSKCGIFH